MDRNKRMLKTTIIYFIGSFGSKLLAFFLLPLYTNFLNPEQFGNVDLILSIVPLIGPVFTLQTTESIFRFLFNCQTEEEKKKTISAAFFIYCIGMLVFGCCFIPYVKITKFEFSFVFGAYFVMLYLSIFAQQVLRGFQKNTSYAITGVISTLVQATVNILLIHSLKEKSLLIAPLISSVIVSVYAIYNVRLWKYLDIKSVSKEEIKKQLIYGIPLVPNQICWWFNGIVGKYIVGYFVGVSANGLLAVATRFPNLVSVIMQIYFLAWTENSIFEFDSKDRDEYFTKNLNGLLKFLICAVSGMLLVVKLYMTWMISEEYSEAKIIIPILFVAMLFNAAATFLGTIYTASMKTKDAFKTTIYAAVSNIICAFCLIPFWGVLGYAVANVISYIIFAYVRLKSVNKIVKIYIDFKQLIGPLCLLGMSFGTYYLAGTFGCFVVLCVEGVIVCVVGKKYIKELLNRIRRRG